MVKYVAGGHPLPAGSEKKFNLILFWHIFDDNFLNFLNIIVVKVSMVKYPAVSQ